jgi:thymidylate synthase (FAD)
MQVKLVSITKPLVEDKDMTAEEFIVYAARVSNPSNQLNTETSEKLINYLIKNKHVSPFEMAHFGVEVKTSRAIAAQILRHWTLAFQEFSQRYAEAVDFEPVQLRRKAATNRQSSEEEFDPLIQGFSASTDEELVHGVRASKLVDQHLENSRKLYQALLAADVAKECARMILPLTTQTTIYMVGDVRTWIFYLQQRTDKHAQLEHRQVALEIEKIFIQHFPNVAKALGLTHQQNEQ